MEKVRYGIIGIGKMGSLHCLRFKYKLIKNGTLTAVCDISPERRQWAEKNLPGVTFFEDYKELMESGLVDAVLIATPHYLHPEMGKAALARGLHTLIEKPAGVFTSAVRELNEAAKEKKGLVYGIMYNQRTNKLYRLAKTLIESGRLGEIKRINWIITDWYRPQAYYDQGGWRGTWVGEGGGALINQCPHQLDLFQWLGGMPSKVIGYAKVGVKRNINVENDVTAYFEYPNGATGVFITSTHDFPGTNRLEIDADKGKLVIENNKLTFTELEVGETQFNATNTKFMPKIPVKKKLVKRITKLGELSQFVTSQHTAILRNFTDAILYGKPLIAPGEEGINGLTISNAIHLSSWTGQPVTLPIDEKLFEEELAKRIEEEKEFNKKKVQL
ncbi:MAG: Gfo/Idh/MocA family oxidoreductase [Clostridiales bacterium]|jgi:predicted dehydrogenase|nr:Gfo/Idh/MocA family oxidoreductase [Clostridiales bacterium]HOB64972.1 Gfo/Idh/MocA family oxidoreductase [Clostridia bacterium]HOK82198.1 Gfo/Idh/MocA family oxidoreductase [Clostridia bacterium]HOL61339.1 Gfo/Idh/MocA family oxidoreductase [Clostridia bacterium]HPO54012.1 Gfo/Idh/MocA family oxidoreductase [Clostridia bacterium]